MNVQDRLNALRREIAEVAPEEARRLQTEGATLIDVREADEVAAGLAEGAEPISRGMLELRIDQVVPDRNRTVLLMCGSGARSLLAADALRNIGYEDVRSVAGGFGRWRDRGLPCRLPEAPPDPRYVRQTNLPEVGAAGQKRLGDARVLLVGAGGLGCPAALYLAGAGVGTLGFVDHDTVEISNLHRQVLHTSDRIGQPKTASARTAVAALNPEITVQTHDERLTRDNVEAIFGCYDIIVDGTDNFPTRYLVNDACCRLGLPNVYGAVERFEGRVSTFRPGMGPCYRCLFPEPPPPDQAPSCAEAGVLGVVPGTVGMLQALEVVKLVVGFGEPLVGRLLVFDARTTRLRTLGLERDPDCAYCASGTAFPGYVDYEAFCDGTA